MISFSWTDKDVILANQLAVFFSSDAGIKYLETLRLRRELILNDIKRAGTGKAWRTLRGRLQEADEHLALHDKIIEQSRRINERNRTGEEVATIIGD